MPAQGPVGSPLAQDPEEGRLSTASGNSAVIGRARQQNPTMPLRHADPPWTTSLTTICQVPASFTSAIPGEARVVWRLRRRTRGVHARGRAARNGGTGTCGGWSCVVMKSSPTPARAAIPHALVPSAGAAREHLVRARRGRVGTQPWACACDGGS